MRSRVISLVFFFLVAASVTAFTQELAPSPSPVPLIKEDNIDLVHLGDLIDVDAIGNFDYDWRGTLTPEGFLNGVERADEPIFALCRSEAAIGDDIAKAYGRTLRDPKVVVRILDKSNRAVVFLDGAVKFPQRFQIRRPVRLNELIIIAGGITENASGELRIFRPRNLSCESPSPATEIVKAGSEAGPQNLSIKISDLLAGREGANPEIVSGDVLTVVEALPIYIMGGVNIPKQISARAVTTLSRAVAAAGGIAKRGQEENIIIYRREAGQTVSIAADLKKIAAQGAEDPVLKAYDIVEVAERGSGRRKFAPVIETAAVQRSKLLNLPLRIIE